MKIRFRLSILMAAIIAVIISGISFTLLQRASNVSLNLTKQSITNLALQQAEYWKGREDAYIRVLRTVANVMADYESVEPELRRNRYDTLLHGVLTGEANMISIYTVWKPNAIDGMDSQFIGREGSSPTGQYAISYSQEGEVITGQTLSQPEINTAIGYMEGENVTAEMVFDPIPARVNGQDTYLIKMAVPIINPRTGETVARVGCFLSIEAMQGAIMNTIESHGEEISAMMVYTNTGFIMAHLNPAQIGKKLSEAETVYGGELQAADRAVKEGTEYEFTYYSPVLFGNVELVMEPFQIGTSATTWTVAVGAAESHILAPINEMTRFTIILAAIAIAAAIVIIYLVLGSVTNPIIRVTDTLKDISEGEGDLTKLIEVKSKDEIGDLANYFNQTIRKIKILITVIKQKTQSLSEVGDDLAANMTETAAAVNEITANIQSIKGRVINQSASVTETNATMEQITVNIEKLNSHVEQQAVSVAQSSSAIEEMLANIQSVTNTLVKNVENVNELTDAADVGRTGLQEVAQDIQEIERESEGLLEINSVMQNIASQTNLLSMNAAIEAAHAGEAGKGFAVVADEIRKLAESSNEQSKIISGVLKKIKTSIDKITQSTNNVLEKFEAIDGGVRTVAEQEENIRNAMEEQGEGSKQILDAISKVNEVTQRVKGSTAEMFEGSTEVIQESKNLEIACGEITGGMKEMGSGADQVNVAVNRVNEISVKTKENIDLLMQEVLRFKVD